MGWNGEETGEFVAAGVLKLDPEKAREKLREFQLSSPTHYVLKLVQAAQVLGARRIGFDLASHKAAVLFDAALEPEELEELFPLYFSENQEFRTRGLRHLAVALNGAEALGLQDVQFFLPQRQTVRFVGGKAQRGDLQKETLEGMTKIIFKVPLKGQALLRFLGRQVTEFGGYEDDLLRTYGYYSPLSIYIDGVLLPKGWGIEGLDKIRPMPYGSKYEVVSNVNQETGQQCVVGLTSLQTSLLGVVYDGMITLVERPSPLTSFGFRAVVEERDLQTNLSSTGFVDDERYQKMLLRVEVEVFRAGLELLKGLHRTGFESPAIPGIQRFCFEVLYGLRTREGESNTLREAVQVIRGLRLFAFHFDGETQTGATIEDLEINGVLCYQPQNTYWRREARYDEVPVLLLRAPPMSVARIMTEEKRQEVGLIHEEDWVRHFLAQLSDTLVDATLDKIYHVDQTTRVPIGEEQEKHQVQGVIPREAPREEWADKEERPSQPLKRKHLPLIPGGDRKRQPKANLPSELEARGAVLERLRWYAQSLAGEEKNPEVLVKEKQRLLKEEIRRFLS